MELKALFAAWCPVVATFAALLVALEFVVELTGMVWSGLTPGACALGPAPSITAPRAKGTCCCCGGCALLSSACRVGVGAATLVPVDCA